MWLVRLAQQPLIDGQLFGIEVEYLDNKRRIVQPCTKDYALERGLAR